ncbi:hypothetical protein [Methylobacillus glycogenes]|nr:hypothetical protein [Methylobacillus glycogenes]
METQTDFELRFAMPLDLAISPDELALIETVMPELLMSILQSSETEKD